MSSRAFVRRAGVFTLGIAAVTAAACGGGDRSPADSASAATASAASVPAPSDGFRVPESVRYDEALDAWFVSNIDGSPSTRDNNGFIVRLDAANPIAQTVIVRGGENGVTLHAPKGMAIVGDTLWVSDIDVVRAFDKRNGTLITSIDLAPLGAVFLNDVVIGPDGVVYVTDTGIRFSESGEVTHPGTDRVFAIAGRTPRVALEGDALLNRPNGIAWDASNSRFVIVPFGSQAIVAWKPGERTVTTVATGPGGFDGVEVLGDGRILVTSWADSSLHLVTDGVFTRVAGSLEAPADIGVDTKRSIVAVPRFNLGRIEYFAIPPR